MIVHKIFLIEINDYRYLEESEALGTAAGLHYFRKEILHDNPSAIFVLNADVCGDLPVSEMVVELERKPDAQCLLLTTEATREQSVNFGCVVIDVDGKVCYLCTYCAFST